MQHKRSHRIVFYLNKEPLAKRNLFRASKASACQI